MRRPACLVATVLCAALSLVGCGASTTGGVGSAAAPSPARTATSATGAPPSTPAPAVTLDPLTGRRTALALDAAFVSALATLRVVPALLGRASLQATTVEFPISGGQLTVTGSAVDGRVEHRDSGLSFTAGTTKIGLTDLVIDYASKTVSSSVLVNGNTAAASATVFDLDTSAQRSVGAGGLITVMGTQATLSEAGAALLNAAFRTTAFKTGTTIGSVTVTATG